MGASDDFCIALYEIINLLSLEIKLVTLFYSIQRQKDHGWANTTRPATESPLPFELQRKTFFSDLSNSVHSPRDSYHKLSGKRERIPVNLTDGSHIAPNTTENLIS